MVVLFEPSSSYLEGLIYHTQPHTQSRRSKVNIDACKQECLSLTLTLRGFIAISVCMDDKDSVVVVVVVAKAMVCSILLIINS